MNGDLCISGDGSKFYKSGSSAEQQEMSEPESIEVAKARVLSEHSKEMIKKNNTDENLKEEQEQRLLAKRQVRWMERMKRCEPGTGNSDNCRKITGCYYTNDNKCLPETHPIAKAEKEAVAAATKIQAVQRGRMGRKAAERERKRKEEYERAKTRHARGGPGSQTARLPNSTQKREEQQTLMRSNTAQPMTQRSRNRQTALAGAQNTMRGGGKKTRVKRHRTKKSRKHKSRKSKKRKSKQHRKKKGSTKKR